MVRLKVCRTCDRYAAAPGASGSDLVAAVARAMPPEAAQSLSVLAVECLSGCKHPAQAMVSGNGPALRFSGLTSGDARALIERALAYAAGPPDAGSSRQGTN